MSSPENIIVTETEAAEMLRLSPRTMQRLRLDGSGPAFVQLTQRRLGYRIVDLSDWTRARAGTATRVIAGDGSDAKR